MNTLVLYSALKNRLSSIPNFPTISQGFMNYNLEKSAGIFLTDISPAYIKLSGKKNVGRNARVQIILQGPAEDQTYFEMRKLCNKIENLADTLQNTVLITERMYYIEDDEITYIDPESLTEENKGIQVLISNTSLSNGTITLEKTPEGHPQFSVTLYMKYYIGDNAV